MKRPTPVSSASDAGRPACRGPAFTLIETLVASVVLAVGVVGLMGTFSVCVQAAARNRRGDQAATLARNLLELAAAAEAGRLGPDRRAAGPFRWSLELSDKPADLLLASVVVEWTDGGVARSFRLEQLFLPRPAGGQGDEP